MLEDDPDCCKLKDDEAVLEDELISTSLEILPEIADS